MSNPTNAVLQIDKRFSSSQFSLATFKDWEYVGQSKGRSLKEEDE
jgi:hypothetical protein